MYTYIHQTELNDNDTLNPGNTGTSDYIYTYTMTDIAVEKTQIQ